MTQFTELVYEFPQITQKLENIILLTKSYISYFKDRASYEREYGQNVLKQSTIPMKKGVFNKENPVDKTETTLKNILQKINVENEKIAQKHIETSTKIQTEIIKPLELLLKDIEGGKKKLVNDTNKSIHNHENLVSQSEKCKQNYKNCLQQHKQLVELQETTPQGPQFEKNKVKIEQLAIKLKKLESDYRDSVDKANTSREVLYSTEMPEVLKGCQELINKHFDGFKNVIELFVNNHIELSNILNGCAEELRNTMSEVNFEKDLEEFVNANANKHEIKNIELEIGEVQKVEEKKEEKVEEKKEDEKPEEKKEEENTEVKEEEKKEDEKPEEKKEEGEGEKPKEGEDSNPFN